MVGRRSGPRAGRLLEADLEREFAQRMASIGAFYKKLHGSLYQRYLPDRYVAHRRWAGWLELKAGDNDLSDKQRDTARKLVEARVPFFVVAQRTQSAVLVEDVDQGVLMSWPGGLPHGITILDHLASLSSECYPFSQYCGF